MSTATLEPIRDVLAFEHEKVWHPAEYRDMTLYAELGARAFTALHASALPRTDICRCGAVVAPVAVVVQAPYPTRYHYEHCGPAWWNEDDATTTPAMTGLRAAIGGAA